MTNDDKTGDKRPTRQWKTTTTMTKWRHAKRSPARREDALEQPLHGLDEERAEVEPAAARLGGAAREEARELARARPERAEQSGRVHVVGAVAPVRLSEPPPPSATRDSGAYRSREDRLLP